MNIIKQVAAPLAELLATLDDLEVLRIKEHKRMYFELNGKLTKRDIDKLWSIYLIQEEVRKAIKLYQDM